ncbi:PREDICTED: uncharacterized protein LOC109190410 [Ipomoea nil]|uniref:uncharacterized protein LOC109190410 n=1 Tax=Ipomoea nil TaxID=35883 RepID=UPI000901B5EC|nr:PREDICTED: uncharacterized protein LOC109190410 [Ipomoea nil]
MAILFSDSTTHHAAPEPGSSPRDPGGGRIEGYAWADDAVLHHPRSRRESKQASRPTPLLVAFNLCLRLVGLCGGFSPESFHRPLASGSWRQGAGQSFSVRSQKCSYGCESKTRLASSLSACSARFIFLAEHVGAE